jgi:hypothetical protein
MILLYPLPDVSSTITSFALGQSKLFEIKCNLRTKERILPLRPQCFVYLSIFSKKYSMFPLLGNGSSDNGCPWVAVILTGCFDYLASLDLFSFAHRQQSC